MRRLIHLKPNQVLASEAEPPCHEICVISSPERDVFILLINRVSYGLLATQTDLNFLTGKGRKYREIDIRKRVHVISGADWGGKFVGISKKT